MESDLVIVIIIIVSLAVVFVPEKDKSDIDTYIEVKDIEKPEIKLDGISKPKKQYKPRIKKTK